MANELDSLAFIVPPNDPLAAEHAAVLEWVEAAANKVVHTDLDLSKLPSGAALLAAKPAQARRFVAAAVVQVSYWDQRTAEVQRNAQEKSGDAQAYRNLPIFTHVWARRRQSAAVITALLRRTLPLDQADLIALLQWCANADSLTTYFGPVAAITKALQRFVTAQPADPELAEAMKQYGAKLRTSYDKACQRLGTTVEQLLPAEEAAEPEPVSPANLQPPPQPAPAGSPAVLVELKQMFGMLDGEIVAETTPLDPDRFPLRTDSLLVAEHDLLSQLFNELVGQPGYHQPNLKMYRSGQLLLNFSPAELGPAIVAAAERHVHALLASSVDYDQHQVWQSRYSATSIVGELVKAKFEVDRSSASDLLLFLSVLPAHQRSILERAAPHLVQSITAVAHESPLSAGERYVLALFRSSLIVGPPLGAVADEVAALTALIGDGATFYLVPGEVWSDAVNEELASLPSKVRNAWTALLKHALSATSARPTSKWLKTAEALIEAVGGDQVRQALLRWSPLVSKGQSLPKLPSYAGDTRGASDTMHDQNATCLRGLLWCVPLLPQRDELTRAVTSVALSAYKKVPGVGPRAVKVGNAAVYALSEFATTDAVGQLAMLKVRVKFGTAQKEIEKAFDSAAAALALPRDQIEELGVPSYGLEEVGRRSETLGSYRAELQVTGTDASLNWFDAAGKPLKSVPAKVKSDHKEELKDLQQSLKDIQAMLPAQRDRIDGLFLLQKSWPLAEWRERYHDHPLVGTIAQRLLWCVDGAPVLFENGVPTDAQGQPIAHGKTAEVTLWHPVGRSVDEVIAWRRRLEALAITQPFKQAHREVYLLTDAERRTATYSNRYAAHVIRQHQFNALCAARGWKNRLRLMVDDSYLPPLKELPQWGLRAEYWVEGVGDGYGEDTNESGVYLRLATDQVRFYRAEAAENQVHASGGNYESNAAGPGRDNINEPLPLDQIPPLVFSEVMRDVDLFVGVASVGNDPNWQDGGAQGVYREYWQSYAFGELSGTASTRKDVLQRLVPRLKIAARCSFSDRFLVVRGDLRTYKIHLGSGNILMEPNDQYLCIVPDAKMRAGQEDLYLPFEGDATLSIIISKALLLAADTKIKDPTITRQLAVE